MAAARHNCSVVRKPVCTVRRGSQRYDVVAIANPRQYNRLQYSTPPYSIAVHHIDVQPSPGTSAMMSLPLADMGAAQDIAVNYSTVQYDIEYCST